MSNTLDLSHLKKIYKYIMGDSEFEKFVKRVLKSEREQILTIELWGICTDKDAFDKDDQDYEQAIKLIKEGANVLLVLDGMLGEEVDMFSNLIYWARKAGYGKMSPNKIDELVKTNEELMKTIQKMIG